MSILLQLMIWLRLWSSGFFPYREELLAKQKGKSLYENIGKASLSFAREYPILFRELSIQPNPYMASYETIENDHG
jgi:hypothetical protein